MDCFVRFYSMFYANFSLKIHKKSIFKRNQRKDIHRGWKNSKMSDWGILLSIWSWGKIEYLSKLHFFICWKNTVTLLNWRVKLLGRVGTGSTCWTCWWWRSVSSPSSSGLYPSMVRNQLQCYLLIFTQNLFIFSTKSKAYMKLLSMYALSQYILNLFTHKDLDMNILTYLKI